MERFNSEVRILDKLALRDDLIREIALKLTLHVSAAAREKLCNSYNLPDSIVQLAVETEIGAVLDIVSKTPEEDLMTVAQTLSNQNKLTPRLLLQMLREDQIAFFEVALSVHSSRSLEHVRSVIRHAGKQAVSKLLDRSRIPQPMHEMYWHALQTVRGQ
jgi:uncharacterized protein (DUF2336 family)